MLRRQRAIEIVPSSKPLRWRRYDVPQHLAPETSDALRFCAVEGDLDLLDRRYRSTIEAQSFDVSTARPARLLVAQPATPLRRAAISPTSAIKTDDGATVLVESQGYGRAYPAGRRQVVGSLLHLSDDDRYRRLNDVMCVCVGEVRVPAAPAGEPDLVMDVAELVWEPIAQ